MKTEPKDRVSKYGVNYDRSYWADDVDDLLADADNPNVSDEEYERRRKELDREAEERKARANETE